MLVLPKFTYIESRSSIHVHANHLIKTLTNITLRGFKVQVEVIGRKKILSDCLNLC